MFDKQKVIDIALAEVGYLEKASNKDLDDPTANAGSANYTKYARDLDNIPGFYNGKKNGFAWCDMFVDWCFVQAYGVENAKDLLHQPLNSLGAGCTWSANYFKQANQLIKKDPLPGDQIFFWNSSTKEIYHTGLVYAVDSTKVYTVEGNTSGASGIIANGGGVCKKSYSLTYSGIYGYGRPKYSDGSTTTTSSTEETKPVSTDGSYVVKAGDSLWEIAANQFGDGSRYKEIMQINGLTSTMLKIGQVLKMPGSTDQKTCNTDLPVLSNGSSGIPVKALQTLLNLRGLNTVVDGSFGSDTVSNVKLFQTAAKIDADGIVGSKTWKALIS